LPQARLFSKAMQVKMSFSAVQVQMFSPYKPSLEV